MIGKLQFRIEYFFCIYHAHQKIGLALQQVLTDKAQRPFNGLSTEVFYVQHLLGLYQQ